MTETEIDLEVFVAIKGCAGKKSPEVPFVVSEFRYATNGHIVIRVPAEGEPNTPGEFPDVLAIWKPYAGKLKAWPKQRYCPQCLDTGKIGCGECERRTCLLCKGKPESGQIIDSGGYRAIWLGSHIIRLDYDLKIRTLSNVRFAARSPYGKPIPFVFDGGEGRIMELMQTDKE